MSDFHLDLDFSLQGQLRSWLGIPREVSKPSLVTPMLFMLGGGILCILALIIFQFVTEYRRSRDLITPQWMSLSRTLQIVLGLVAALLLGLIGFFLSSTHYKSVFPFVLCGLLVLRVVIYGIQVVLTKH